MDHSSGRIPDASGRGNWRGRGQENGRGRGRGQGRGRGFPVEGNWHRDRSSANINAGSQRARAPRPLLTHFLALPLGHHAAFREKITSFTNALLRTDPVIAGLDQSIIVPARRLHFTLGVMALDGTMTEDGRIVRTVEAAQALLNELKPQIIDMLQGVKLRAALRNLDIMPPERGDATRAHVMWIGPSSEDQDGRRLKAVCGLVNGAFRKAGLVVEEGRALKLHCTVLNTSYRKPRSSARVPFSYAAISTASGALEAIGGTRNASSSGATATTRGPLKVDCGDWDLDEIQICEMGSWGPEGEYVCVGRCALK